MEERFELPAELNIYSALETRDALLAWVTQRVAAGSERLEISAAQVVEVDGAGLQLVAALSNMEQAWNLVDCSQPFADACSAMGLGKWVEKFLANSSNPGAKA